MPRYGRIPDATTNLLEQTVKQVRDEIMTALPAGASPALQSFTLESMLDTILRDWRENDNTTGLLKDDITDLRSFVQLASSIAGNDPGGRGLPVYQATLKGLLDDWLDNWNADGQVGPPHRA